MTKRIAGWILVLMLVFQAGLASRSEAEGVDLNPAEGEELMIGLNRDEETARSLLDQFDKNLIDANTFLAAFRDLNVIFSTPYGETKDGQARGYYFPAGDGTAFFPVFTSAERARAYYDAGDRNGYLLMIDSFLGSLKTVQSANQIPSPCLMGIIIDPGDYGITLHASMLDKAIELLDKNVDPLENDEPQAENAPVEE
ncbi:MAG: SseB family protein [Clostridia bacterium]|nr:SseB family protein [Clostridia bacterium]